LTAELITDRPYLDDIEVADRSTLRSLQEQRLLELVPYAYEHSALTRSVWQAAGVHPRDIRTIDDFTERAPYMDKQTIRDFRSRTSDPWGGLLCMKPGALAYLATTTGTSGVPTPLVRAKATPQMPNLEARNYWMIGLRPDEHFVWYSGTSRGGHYHPGSAFGWKSIFVQHSTERRDLQQLLEVSAQYKPTVLRYLSNAVILALDELAQELRIDVREVLSCYRAVVRGGEPISAKAAELASEWGITLFDMTSLCDITVAWECDAHNGHHTWEDAVLVEYVEPWGDGPAPPGTRAELVGTSLMERGGPFVRYRSDDLVEFTHERCACGRTHGRLWTVGRKGDETIVGGRSVMPIDVRQVVEVLDATSDGLFQVIRRDREVDLLRLRIGYRPGWVNGSLISLRSDATDLLTATLDIPVEVELVEYDELLKLGPPTKIPRVVPS
jgi:phenylacetate-CoA ligase